MRARAVMVLGTGSHVGKSLMATALCRIFARAGYRVAPFKSQNMSLNSAATAEGLEIGRAQALQAEAAGVAARVAMNPVLIKPTGEMSSQIVVRGEVWGRVTAKEYFARRVEELWPVVCASYEELAAEFEVIVIEGAGSPAEINLKAHDIVNMRVAAMAEATCLLVGDIDRGGVFASLLGTVELLEPDEQARIGGFMVNKFRGDVGLLEPGLRMMEERMGKPCLGVVRYLPGLVLEEEDSLGMEGRRLCRVGDGGGCGEASAGGGGGVSDVLELYGLRFAAGGAGGHGAVLPDGGGDDGGGCRGAAGEQADGGGPPMDAGQWYGGGGAGACGAGTGGGGVWRDADAGGVYRGPGGDGACGGGAGDGAAADPDDDAGAEGDFARGGICHCGGSFWERHDGGRSTGVRDPPGGDGVRRGCGEVRGAAEADGGGVGRGA